MVEVVSPPPSSVDVIFEISISVTVDDKMLSKTVDTREDVGLDKPTDDTTA